MRSIVVEMTWNNELGEHWMNVDNIKSCLFTMQYVGEKLLTVEEIKPEREQGDQSEESPMGDIEFFIRSTIARMNKADSKQIAAIEHLEKALQSLAE